jgi:hypothetical protein
VAVAKAAGTLRLGRQVVDKKTDTHYLVGSLTTAVIASNYWYFLVVHSIVTTNILE